MGSDSNTWRKVVGNQLAFTTDVKNYPQNKRYHLLQVQEYT